MELPSCPGRFVLRGTCSSSQRPNTATAKHNIRTALNAFKTMGGGRGGRGSGVPWLGSEEAIMEGDFQVTALSVRFPLLTNNTLIFRTTRIHCCFSFWHALVMICQRGSRHTSTLRLRVTSTCCIIYQVYGDVLSAFIYRLWFSRVLRFAVS